MADDLSPRLAAVPSFATFAAFRPMAWSLAIAAAVIAALAWAAIHASFNFHRERESARLESLAELRAVEVGNWLADKLSQARFAGNSPLGEQYVMWQDQGDLAARDKMLGRLASFHKATGAHSVLVMDDSGSILASEPPQPMQAHAELLAAARLAIERGVPQFTPFHSQDAHLPSPRMDIVAPLALSGNPARAVIVVRLDPKTHLLPMLARWPVPSRTASATLVRREGDELVGPFARVRLPISAPDLLAAKVLRGEAPVGVALEALDFRGREVLGVLRPVPGTGWFLVARVDRDEVYADARTGAAWIIAAALLAFVATGAIAYWRRERLALRAVRLESAHQEATRERLEELVALRTRELADKNVALERTVGDLEAFSASISHDLRAPLRTVNGFATLLERSEGDKLSDDGRRKLDRILAGSRTMDRMIEDILACSRANQADMEFGPVDLNQVAQDVVHELAPQYPAAEIVLGPLPVVQADQTMARQVFGNLVGNALKFSARQFRPRIEVGTVEGPDGPRLFVRDNGVGFDAADSDRLFAPFQRLHEDEFAGTGVGLSIVKRLIERHGGAISAESAPGGPTTFVFDLGARVAASAEKVE